MHRESLFFVVFFLFIHLAYHSFSVIRLFIISVAQAHCHYEECIGWAIGVNVKYHSKLPLHTVRANAKIENKEQREKKSIDHWHGDFETAAAHVEHAFYFCSCSYSVRFVMIVLQQFWKLCYTWWAVLITTDLGRKTWNKKKNTKQLVSFFLLFFFFPNCIDVYF